tara:strand:- start:737 stop:838 length:102 start_codon:yes stop_codon:yes gene_type:complete
MRIALQKNVLVKQVRELNVTKKVIIEQEYVEPQ